MADEEVVAEEEKAPSRREAYTGEEDIYLPTPGYLPGIPGGEHGPGAFHVNWDDRTIEAIPPTPVGVGEIAAAPVTPPEEGA